MSSKEKTTTQQSDWRDGFLFLGNHFALDFVNTRPISDDQQVELLPDFYALLRWFQAAGLLVPDDVASLQQRWGKSRQARQTLDAVRELREKLREEILAWEHGGSVHHATVDELNRLMADHPMRSRLKARGQGLETESYFAPEQPADLFAPLTHSAANLFADVESQRVRKCDVCILHFYDTSKKGTRRWCSMQLCGNRQKVAAYAARQRLKNQ